jgi:hypothetical protein
VSSEGLPIFPTLPYGKQPDYPSLRALREHILIVRPQRARRMVWLFPSHPSRRPAPILGYSNAHGSHVTSALEQCRSPKEAPAADHARDRPTIRTVAVACVPCVHEGGAGLSADRACRRDLCPHPPPMARRQLDLSRVLQADRGLVSLSPFARQASRRDVERIRIALPRACDRGHHT